MNRNVLICSAGRRVALVRIVQQTLLELGVEARVLACDASPMSAAGEVADGFTVVPLAGTAEFIPALLELCRNEQVGLVIPTNDVTLAGYAAAKDLFAELGTTVAISSPATVALASDKRQTWTFFRAHEIPTVRQTEAEAVRRDPRAWNWPLVVKPPSGSSSLGVSVVVNDLQFEAAVAGRDVVVQELARGAEYTIDLFVGPDGALRDAVPRQRLTVRGGEVTNAVTVRAEPLLQIAEQVVGCLPGAFGVLNLQVFWDGVNAPRALELNPRFGGGYPLTEAAGAPFVRWLLEAAWGRPLTVAPGGWEDGLTMLRYDEAVLVRTKKAVTP